MKPDADVVFLIDASSSVVDLRFKGCGEFKTTQINQFTNRIIDRFDQEGYFTGGPDGMHVAAVTYKNIANIGFGFKKNASSIKKALNNLDLDGKVAATYVHRGFDVIKNDLLTASYGFRGFGSVPVVIVVISDGRSHFEDVVGGQAGSMQLKNAVAPFVQNTDVYRVVLEIFDTDNNFVYNTMADGANGARLPLHCDVGGVAQSDVSSDKILDAATERIYDHIIGIA